MKRTKLVAVGVGAIVLVVGVGYVIGIKSRGNFPRYRFPPVALGTTSAIAFYEARLAQGHRSPLDLIAYAGELTSEARRLGDPSFFDKAESMARESLKMVPTSNPGALLVLAEVAQARHDFAGALSYVAEARKQGAGRGDGVASLVAKVKLAQGDLDGAGRAADEAVDALPSVGSHTLRALVFSAQGRDEEARFEFERALAREDVGEAQESAWSRTLFARHLLDRGRSDLAEELAREALRIIPKYPLALDLMARLEGKKGHWESAESFANEAFAVSRETVYLARKASLRAARGDAAGAQALWAQAEGLLRSELARGAYGHRLELARVIVDRGRPAEAAEAVELTREELTVRRTADLLYLHARALALVQRWPQARDAIRDALRIGARTADYYWLAGQVEQQLGSRARADFYFDLATRIDPQVTTSRATNPGVS